MSLDESIDDIFSTSASETPQRDQSTIVSRSEMDKSTFSIDDELADFLGDSSTPVSNIKTESAPIVSSTEKKDSDNADSDFMSWLSDATDTNILTTTTPNQVEKSLQAEENISKSDIDTLKETPKVVAPTTTIVPAAKSDSFSVDNFLEDILGESKPVPKAAITSVVEDTATSNTVGSGTAAPDSITFSAEASLSTPSVPEYADFDSQIDAILKSSFPNIAKLKDTITRHMGFIPDAQRGPIWNLLLTGQFSEDFEASSVGPVSGLESVINKDKLIVDVDEIVSNSFLFHPRRPASDQSALKQSLQNILVLYCTRKQVPYQSNLLSLLTPLLTSNEPIPVSIASSCFYNLVTDFVPFTDTQVCIYMYYVSISICEECY